MSIIVYNPIFNHSIVIQHILSNFIFQFISSHIFNLISFDHPALLNNNSTWTNDYNNIPGYGNAYPGGHRRFPPWIMNGITLAPLYLATWNAPFLNSWTFTLSWLLVLLLVPSGLIATQLWCSLRWSTAPSNDEIALFNDFLSIEICPNNDNAYP